MPAKWIVDAFGINPSSSRLKKKQKNKYIFKESYNIVSKFWQELNTHSITCAGALQVETFPRTLAALKGWFVLKWVRKRCLTIVRVLPTVADGKLKPLYLAVLSLKLSDCFDENNPFTEQNTGAAGLPTGPIN